MVEISKVIFVIYTLEVYTKLFTDAITTGLKDERGLSKLQKKQDGNC